MVNVAITSTYWQIGKRIVEAEQRGAARADYGEELIERLSRDLSKHAGRGFGSRNLAHMRKFFLTYPRGSTDNILQTATAKSGEDILQTLSAKSSNVAESPAFPLPWSHYTLLLAVKNENARHF